MAAFYWVARRGKWLALGVFQGEGSGESYVYFGHDFNGAVTHAGTPGADTLVATAGADVIVGGQGDDAMSGNGGADVFRGGAGNDRIKIAASDFSDLDGGTGSDTLALGGTGFELDLTRIADSRTTGIEAIDLGSGHGDHALKLSLRDLLNLSETENTLTVKGDADDSVEIATGVWTDAGVRGDYHVYLLDAAMLRVHTDITSVDITTLT
jgi:Ca2+-binding RTX toxin-like protein